VLQLYIIYVYYKTVRHIKILIQKYVCFTTFYFQGDIIIVFTLAFKCVLKIHKTYVNFTGPQDENYFVVEKCSLPENWQVSRLCCRLLFFSIKWECKHLYCEQWIQWLHFASQHTHTHTHTYTQDIHIYTLYIDIYIYIFVISYWTSCGIFRLRHVTLQVASSQWVVSV